MAVKQAIASDADRPEAAAFGRSFWFAYAANAAMMTAVSLLFVFADFVKVLGGTEEQLGRIVGIGMIGSICVRLAQGIGIDRFGPRHIWLWSTVAYVAACALFPTVRRVDGPYVYALRIAYQSSLAGIFGASIAYVSGRAPVARMAEVIGTLGTSGFVGMMLGSAAGRFIVGDGALQRPRIDQLFHASAAMGVIALLFTWFASEHRAARPSTRRRPPLWWLLRRYNPGLVLLMSVATGMGLNLPTVFLRPYMRELQLASGVMFFFNLYPPIAFAARLALRRIPDRLGIRPMIGLGVTTLVVGMATFLIVRRTADLVWPALFIGVAHACLFPAVVAGASGAFPPRWRGIGTTLVLAMFDVGTLCGSPLAGELLAAADRHRWPKYPTMFLTISALLTACGAVYFGFSRRVPKRRG